ncbi:MAG TPA: helix-turn-helix transcriptional regulator [Steroidobacteraceae bacterium]|nr:helix-turn-helix transcriptional regulator [Steroidobacteraceae bacterium]
MRAAVDRNIRRDWISAERSLFNRCDSYTTENLMMFPGGRIEVRRFSWSRPIESVWETGKGCYLFNMSLSNHEPTTTWTHVETGLRQQMTGRKRLTFVPPGQKIASSFGAGNSRSVCCMLDAKLVEAFLTEAPRWNWSQSLLDDCANVGGTEIEWLLRRMYREVRQPDFATPEVLGTLARQVGIEVVRRFKLRQSESGQRTRGLASWRMRLIRERLASGKPLPDLEELAALCNVTVRHLTRAFRIETGRTLGRYIDDVMVERARALLQARTPVVKVARLLGYSHARAFASAFRRTTGVTPSEIKPEQRR